MARVIVATVVDAQGRPCSGARIAVESAPVAMPEIAAVTDADGAVSLAAPADGDYRLAAFADGHSPARADATVAGATTRVTLRLGRG